MLVGYVSVVEGTSACTMGGMDEYPLKYRSGWSIIDVYSGYTVLVISCWMRECSSGLIQINNSVSAY